MAATVLVIDGGGRGSALVAKYLQSPHVSKVLAIPGNDLMLQNKRVKIFPNIKTTDLKNIKKVCRKYKVDLVDVAQDDAVAVGVTDSLTRERFNIFGPTKLAGQIEWDKAWGRNFIKKFNIPTPKFKICTSQKEGIAYVKNQKDTEWFIKASGLTAGKGALYAKDNRQAQNQIRKMKTFGKAGETYLIEECIKGEEFSSFAIVDGINFVLVGHAQDHKRVFDGDHGSNTGGMGCSSPPMAITPKIEKQINVIFKKTITGLAKIDRPYRGILYLGGMLVKEKGLVLRSSARQSEGRVYVIEFNARWGDPEAQVIIPSIKNDLYQIAKLTIAGKIKKIKIKKDNLYRIVVTAASRGYPDDYSAVIGKQIIGIERLVNQSHSIRYPEPSPFVILEHSRVKRDEAIESIKVYGAGVKKQNGKYMAHGGRLFYVMAAGKNVAEARTKAYNALSKTNIKGDNLHYRTDIGWRDLERYYIKKYT